MALTYEPIATVALSSTASINFSGWSNLNYNDYRLVIQSAPSTSGTSIRLQLASFTTSYGFRSMAGLGSSSSSTSAQSQTSANLTGGQSVITGIGYTIIVDFFQMYNTIYKTFISQFYNNASSTSGSVVLSGHTLVAVSSNTNINSMSIFPSSGTFGQGFATLYGIKAL